MLDMLFQHADVITMRDEEPVLKNVAVGVKNGRIALPGDESCASKRVIDASGHILMPGLVNAHAHLAMTLLRGYADDYALHDWLAAISPAEVLIDSRAAYVSAMLGIAEMLSCGVTSVSDMDMQLCAVLQAVLDAGINASVCNSALCDPSDAAHTLRKDPAFEEIAGAHAYHGADGGRVRMDMGIHAEYTSTPALCREIAQYAVENGYQIQLHLSETIQDQKDCIRRHGVSPAKLLEDTGVFDVPVTAAHCVAATPEDRGLFARHGVTVAHNPVSNLKLGSGIANVVALLGEGVNVALGTDSACSNNTLDLFEELKLAALLQKGTYMDAQATNAYAALKTATVNGAKAQGRDTETGRIREGLYADLILLDARSLSMYPVYDPVSAAVYAATGRNVVITMVRGKILYERGKFSTLDVSALMEEARHIVNRLPTKRG